MIFKPVQCHGKQAERCILLLVIYLTATVVAPSAGRLEVLAAAEPLHPKFALPASCFAYVGDAKDPRTWKLPYLLADGRPDLKRLPAAIEAATTGYRGKAVSGIPDDQLPAVLVKLGKAAAKSGKMPFQNHKTAATYWELQRRLESLGRLDEIKH
jgi:hypothetical protein